MKIEDIKVGRWYGRDDIVIKIVAIEEGIAFYIRYCSGLILFGNGERVGSIFFDGWEEIDEPLFAKKPEVIENEGVFYCRVVDKGNPASEFYLLDHILGKYCYSSGFSSIEKTKALRKSSQKIFKVKFAVKATEIIEVVNDE